MFADACEKAMRYTFPIVVSARNVDGTTISSVGSMVVINREGWFMTAGHLFVLGKKQQDDAKKMKEIDEGIKAGTLPADTKYNPKWITNHSIWCPWNGVKVSEAQVFPDIDIAIGKFIGFKPEMVKEYPVFKDPSTLRVGTSLCRIGFPFNGKAATIYDEEKGVFTFVKGAFPFTVFANDGIFTRSVLMGEDKTSGIKKLYLETSTPGLKGQSGGPIFDRKGYVVAMQAHTANLELGFSPVTVSPDGTKTVENQFLNVGHGIHVETITKLLDVKHIRYESEKDQDGFRIVG